MADNVARLLTETEAADYLGMSSAALARVRRAGKISHIQMSARRYRYTVALLEGYLRSQTVAALTPEARLRDREDVNTRERHRTPAPSFTDDIPSRQFPMPKRLARLRVKEN
jgi:hypothetical protein